MNVWIAKLGPEPFSEIESRSFEAFCRDEVARTPVLRTGVPAAYTTPGVEYRALASDPAFANKTYSVVAPSGELLAYSGTFVGPRPARGAPLRSAACLANEDLTDFSRSTGGQFAVLRAGDRRFECAVDALGSHKVFYHRSDTGTVWVTNHIGLLRRVRGHRPSLERWAEWVGLGTLYGYATDELDVQTLPEHGHLTWSEPRGLNVSAYRPLSDLLPPPGQDFGELLDEAAEELALRGAYLAEHHQLVVPLSGGYDSRIVLATLASAKPERLQCYTYPDHRNDVRLARAVARRLGYAHSVVVPTPSPSLSEARAYVWESGPPFPDYTRVFHYCFEPGVNQLLTPGLKVTAMGLGGEPGMAVPMFGSAEGLSPPDAIGAFVKAAVRRDVLTADAISMVDSRLTAYMQEKYLPLLESHPGPHRLPSFYFHLERFRGQGWTQHLLRFSDVVFPFASTRFIRAAFGAPTPALDKWRRNSLHHELERRLTSGRLNGIPFAISAHWEASWMARQAFKRFRQYQLLLDRVFGTMKFASAIQWAFYRKNEPAIVSLVEGSEHAEVWRFVRRDQCLAWVRDGERLPTHGMQTLLRILPLLEPAAGAWSAATPAR